MDSQGSEQSFEEWIGFSQEDKINKGMVVVVVVGVFQVEKSKSDFFKKEKESNEVWLFYITTFNGRKK